MASLLKRLRTNIPFLISFILLLLSLTQTAYKTDYYDKTANEASGFMEFILGWTGIFYMPYGIPWLANPLLIASWLTSDKNIKRSLLLSFLAVCFSASFLLYHTMPANEAPTYSNITGIGPGYWLWLASCSVFFLGCIFYSFKNLKSDKPHAPANS